MKRGYSLFYAILFLFLCFCIVLYFVANTNTVYAESNEVLDGKTIDTIELNQTGLCIVNDSYNIYEEISGIYLKANHEGKIKDIKVVTEHEECSSRLLQDEVILLSIHREYACQYSTINVLLLIEDGFEIECKVFLLENEQGVFFSAESYIETTNVWISYIKSNRMISDADAINLQKSIYDDNFSEYSEKVFSYSGSIYREELNARGNKDTYADGTLLWRDNNGATHSLQMVKVELYDDNSVIDDLLATTYTNSFGYYSFVFQNNDSIFDHYGSDIYVKVYAGDNNDYVVQPNETKYSKAVMGTGYYFNDVTTGSTHTFDDYIFEMNDSTGQAMQISQAIIAAREFARSQIGHMPQAVRTIYPDYGSICNYTDNNKTIHIVNGISATGLHSYESWDVIMHEYGHHIENELNIINSPGGEHYISHNMIGEQVEVSAGVYHIYTKDEGIRLAWAEAWATVFGIIAQYETPMYVSTIPTVCDMSYTAYNNVDYSIESCPHRKGEGCESSIEAILWDLYDSNPDLNDYIDLTMSEW